MLCYVKNRQANVNKHFSQNLWLSRGKILMRMWVSKDKTAFYMDTERKPDDFSNAQ